MKKQWRVEVDGVIHEVVYETKLTKKKLTVDGAEISLGIRLSSPGIPISEQLVLPLDNVLRPDIGYLIIAKIREDLCIANMILAGGSADTDPRIAVLAIDFYEIFEGHI